ncbi:MAG: hypothetical protein U9N01_04455 [Euryarchaeota archaeon]|nr:hypothetical protein [Euryarchaeota archaeon]
MNDTAYCGCDPGLNGAFAVISGGTISYKMVMPTLTFTTKEGKKRREIDREGVLSFLSTLPPHTHVAVEKQEAYRSQNVTSSCTICKNYGILLMALTAAHLFITEVPAKDWHEHFGIVSVKKGKGTTKAQALEIVKGLYPNTDFRKSEKAHVAHDGITDACLIALYCQSIFQEHEGAVHK